MDDSKTGAGVGDRERIVSDNSDLGAFRRFTETPVSETDADVKSGREHMLSPRRGRRRVA